MSSLNPTCVSGELALPPTAAGPRVLSQAIALEHGDVVYEVVSRERNANGMRVQYRALQRSIWDSLKKLPRQEWPLNPEEEKLRQQKLMVRAWEPRLLLFVSLLLCLGILKLTLDLSVLWPYAKRLQALTTGRAAVVPIRAQDKWVAELNALAKAFNDQGGVITAFHFGADNVWARIDYRGDAQTLIKDTIGREAQSTKEGIWSWRE